MQIVIHSGMHKTGTTSLQYLCTKNRKVLMQFGVYYPDFGVPHHGKFLNSRREFWDPDFCKQCIDDAQSMGKPGAVQFDFRQYQGMVLFVATLYIVSLYPICFVAKNKFHLADIFACVLFVVLYYRASTIAK